MVLAPQSGEHGDDLLLPAHDPGQEYGAVLGGNAEGLLDGIVVAHVDELGAFQQNVRQHEDDHGQVFLPGLLSHQVQELLLPLQHTGAVHTGDLADGEVVAGNVEFFIVG